MWLKSRKADLKSTLVKSYIKNVLYEFKNKDHKKEFQYIYKSTFQRLKS